MRSTSSFPVAHSLVSIYVENVVWYVVENVEWCVVENVVWYVVEDFIINLNNYNCFSSLVIQAQRFLLPLDANVLAER